MTEKYNNLTMNELQDLIKSRGLSSAEKREDLIKQLVHYDQMKEIEALEREFELDADVEETSISLPVMKESVISDDEDVDFLLNENPTTTAPPAKEEPSFKFTPITFDTDKNNSKKPTPEDLLKKEAERRLERSKRFGVQLSDIEKRQLRAARFGIEVTKPEILNKVNKGKVTKGKKKAVQLTAATKSNVLIKKQENMNKLKQGTIQKNKKTIIQQRKNTLQSNNTRFKQQQQQQPKLKQSHVPKQQQTARFKHQKQQRASKAINKNNNNRQVSIIS